MRLFATLALILLALSAGAPAGAQSSSDVHAIAVTSRTVPRATNAAPQYMHAGRCPVPKVVLAAAGGGLAGLLAGHFVTAVASLGMSGDSEGRMRTGRLVGAVAGAALVASFVVHEGSDC